MENIFRRLADHPVRHIVQNAICCLPGTRWMRMRRSNTGTMNKPESVTRYAQIVIDAASAADVSIVGSRLAEVGPGHSLGVALSLLLAGAKQVFAIDVRDFADPNDLEQFIPIRDKCESKCMVKVPRADLADLVRKLTYTIVDVDGNWPLPDASCHIVYSFYSGEHLRSPHAVLKESNRVLKSGGLCMYAIDMRDHYHFNDNWLQFLYYEPRLWEAMTGRRGRWTNRIRSPQWREIFKSIFDELVVYDELSEQPFPEQFDRSKLASPFREFSQQTLEVSHLWIVARKC